RDILVVDDLAPKLLEQSEHDVGFPRLDLVANGLELIMHAQRADLVACRTQRAHHVVFGLPNIDFLLAVALARIRRNEVRMHQHQHAKPLHSAIHLRRSGPNSACTVFAVSSTVNSIMSCRCGPTARKLSSRQRTIMSSRRASSVS